jgi:hypothetical protein
MRKFLFLIKFNSSTSSISTVSSYNILLLIIPACSSLYVAFSVLVCRPLSLRFRRRCLLPLFVVIFVVVHRPLLSSFAPLFYRPSPLLLPPIVVVRRSNFSHCHRCLSLLFSKEYVGKAAEVEGLEYDGWRGRFIDKKAALTFTPLSDMSQTERARQHMMR